MSDYNFVCHAGPDCGDASPGVRIARSGGFSACSHRQLLNPTKLVRGVAYVIYFPGGKIETNALVHIMVTLRFWVAVAGVLCGDMDR